MRHEIEERESKANRREEEGNARDGDLRIDLASGVAVINIPGKPGADPNPTVEEKPPARSWASNSAAPVEGTESAATSTPTTRRAAGNRQQPTSANRNARTAGPGTTGS